MRDLRVPTAVLCTLTLATIGAPTPSAGQELPFAAPWLGYNAGSSAYDTNPAPFERDPTGLATVDLDGDGDLDVAVSNYEFSSPGGGTDGLSGFAVLLNLGAGEFSEPTHYTVSSDGCWDIAAADFDEDGDADLVVPIANAFWDEGNSVALFRNDGAGSFELSGSFTVGTAPTGVAVDDFDGDGHLDIATSNRQNFQPDGSVSVLFGDGTGQFATAVTYLVDPSSFKIVAGDLDGDQRPDLAVAHDWQQVTVLLNDGAGGFGAPVAYDALFDLHDAMAHSAIALGDADNDGDLDLFYSNSDSEPVGASAPRIVHLTNDGNGFFSRAEDILLTSFSSGPSDLAVADLDGDGWNDVAGTNFEGRSYDGARVALNDGLGGFGEPLVVPAGQGTFGVATADVDGDGDADLLTADRMSMAVTVHRNPGTGQFPVHEPRYDSGTSSTLHLVAGDVDGDGDLDLLASGEGFGTPGAVIANHGDGSFAEPTVITHSTDYGRGVSWGKLRDLDGDGDLDLLYNDAHTDFFTGYDFWTAANDGAGNFGPLIEWDLGTCGNGEVDAFDLDNDGDLDVVNAEELSCGSVGNNRLFIRLNHGDGTFAPAYVVEISGGPHTVAGDDFNGDGNVDLVTTHWMPYGDRDFINVHLGNGDGTFQEEVVYTVGRGPRWVVIEDLDNDGHLDLATANSSSDNSGRETLTVLFGTGDGSFGGRTDYYAPYSPDLQGVQGLAAGDADGDGDPDLMMTTVANGVAIYYNDGDGAFSFPHRLGVYWGPFSPVFADLDGDQVPDLTMLVSEPPSGLGRSIATLRGQSPVGGGIACDDLLRFQSRCVGGMRTRLLARVMLTDSSHDGEQVTLTIDGVERTLTIRDDRAQTVLVNPAPGVHSVVLSDPAGCFPERQPVCPGS